MVQVLERYSNSSEQGERLHTLVELFRERAQRPRARTARRVCRRLSEAEVAELVKAYADGEPIHAIIDRFHVDQTTVQKHVRAAGLPRRVTRITADQTELCVELYQDGRSMCSIAIQLGVGDGTVRRALVKAGVELRR